MQELHRNLMLCLIEMNKISWSHHRVGQMVLHSYRTIWRNGPFVVCSLLSINLCRCWDVSTCRRDCRIGCGDVQGSTQSYLKYRVRDSLIIWHTIEDITGRLQYDRGPRFEKSTSASSLRCCNVAKGHIDSGCSGYLITLIVDDYILAILSEVTTPIIEEPTAWRKWPLYVIPKGGGGRQFAARCTHAPIL